MKKFLKYPILFYVGGFVYYMIEIISRGFSHWSMFILGGLCFVIIGSLNEILGRKTTLFPQMLLGAGIITLLEYITGYIVNIKLGWNVWDYSDKPLNVNGQICLQATLAWFALSLVAIVLDDYIRYKWFDYPKPEYKFFK